MAGGDPAAGGRKLVTALFCDVVGSTALGEGLDPEVTRHVMEEWFASADAALSRHGGLVEKYIGDAVVAIFGVPLQHEDDAVRACQAALALLSMTLAGPVGGSVTARGLRVRIGVESGLAVVGDTSRGSTFATGSPVNLAARLQQSAEPGTCLVGPTCRELVAGIVDLAPLDALRLKGVEGDVSACLLLAAPSLPPERPQVGAFVGRHHELARIKEIVMGTKERGGGRLVTMVGEAGMGKTRLVDEVLRSLPSGYAVLRTRCLAYGDGVAWWPLVDLVRQAASLSGAEPSDLARRHVAEFVGEGGDLVAGSLGPAAGLGGTPSSADDIAWALERLIERVATPDGVLVVVEDAHWASDTLVDVLDQVATWVRAFPVVMLVNTRPELIERRPTWAGASPGAEMLRLGPLGDGEVNEMVTSMLGGDVEGEVVSRIRSVIGGNPLFAVQTVGHLVDEGALLRSDGTAWELRDGLVPTVPIAVSALIASRIDRLPPAERQLMGAASVMGDVFYRRPLQELGVSSPGTALLGLLRTGMIRPCGSDLPREQALAFEHASVREAAYAGLSLQARASLHQLFARWLAREHPDPVHEGIIGSHLEAAFLNRVTLEGAGKTEVTDLGAEAAERLATAARQLARVDEPASVSLFRRAVGVAPPSGLRDRLKLELARRLAESYIDTAAAVGLADEVHADAVSRADDTLEAMATLFGRSVRLASGSGSAGELEGVVHRVGALGDGGALGRLLVRDAESLLANLRTDPGDLKKTDLAAATAAAEAGYLAESISLQQAVHFKSIFDATHVDECIEAWRQWLSEPESRALTLKATAALKLLAAVAGRPDELLPWDDLEAEVDQVRSTLWEPVLVLRASTALYLSDWPQALALQERLCRLLDAAGVSGRVSTEAAFAAVSSAQLGDVDGADRYAGMAVSLAVEGDVSPLALAAAVRDWVAVVRDGQTSESSGVEPGSRLLGVLPDLALVELTRALTAERLADGEKARQLRQKVRDLYVAKGAEGAAANVRL